MTDLPTSSPTNTIPTDPQTDPLAGAVLQDLASSATPSPTPVGGRRKELLHSLGETPVNSEVTATPETPATPEVPSSVGAEVEPTKELGPEIEKTIERIEQHKVSSTQETAVHADQKPTTPPNTVAQPVVVLPMSEQSMKNGKGKNSSFSIRWLYEWSVRQMKKFADILVVYRE